ncbi:MAG TPA: hypothetical protein VEP30_06980 [Chthoniobacterales bacterium]|nr:hypothetical protein [Chthoniobacterales bacterium]
MKTAYRPIAIAIVLTLGCGALTVVLRAFAQPRASNVKLTLNIDGYARLKSSYHGNHDEFERLLQQHGSAYYLKHHNDTGDRVHQKGPKPASATGAQHAPTSEIIPVQLTTSSPTPAATAGMPLSAITGPSVTQTLTTASAADMQAVLSAFEP